MRGRQIAAARALLGLSQPELADQAMVGRSTVLRIETEIGTPKPDTVARLRRYLEGAGCTFIDDADGIGVVVKSLPAKDNAP